MQFVNKLKNAPENCSILCHTRLGIDSEKVFQKLWGGQAYFNSYSNNQRGLAILFKDSLPAKDIKIENIIKGNYTRLSFTIKAQKTLVKCIYAPNKDMTANDIDNYSNTFLISHDP